MVSSLVGFVTALASNHQSVMNAMFAHEFTGTDIERQHGLNTVAAVSQTSFRMFCHSWARSCRDTAHFGITCNGKEKGENILKKGTVWIKRRYF